jgi:hypothetical protein
MRNVWAFVIVVLVVAVALAAFLGPFASKAPDGLDRVAQDQGFSAKAAATKAPLADYSVPFGGDKRVSTGIAGALGTLIVFGLGLGVAKLIGRRREAS